MTHDPAHPPAPRGRPCARGFSLLELAIVVVVVGTIAAIAIPRMSSASESARENSLERTVQVVQKAIDMYAAEHGGRSPAHLPNDTASDDVDAFVDRLTGRTTFVGVVQDGGPFGPYLRDLPDLNVVTGRKSVRIDGAAAGANTHAFHFDSGTLVFSRDDTASAFETTPIVAPTGPKALIPSK